MTSIHNGTFGEVLTNRRRLACLGLLGLLLLHLQVIQFCLLAGNRGAHLFHFTTVHGTVNNAPLPCNKEESRTKYEETYTIVHAG